MSLQAITSFEASVLEPVRPHQAHCEQLENQITELAAHIHAATYRFVGIDPRV